MTQLFTVDGVVQTKHLHKHIENMSEIYNQYISASPRDKYLSIMKMKDSIKSTNVDFFTEYQHYIPDPYGFLYRMFDLYQYLHRFELCFIQFDDVENFLNLYPDINHSNTPLIISVVRAIKNNQFLEFVQKNYIDSNVFDEIIEKKQFINNAQCKEEIINNYLLTKVANKIDLTVNEEQVSFHDIEKPLEIILENSYDENINFEKILLNLVRRFKGHAFIESLIYIIEKYQSTNDPKKLKIATLFSSEIKTAFSKKSLKSRNIKTIRNFLLLSTFDHQTKLDIINNLINTWVYDRKKHGRSVENIYSLTDIYQWTMQHANEDTQIKMMKYIDTLLTNNPIGSYRHYTSHDTNLNILSKNINYLFVVYYNETNRSLNDLLFVHLIQLSKHGKTIDFLSLISDELSIETIKKLNSSKYKDEFNEHIDSKLYLAMMFLVSLKDLGTIPNTRGIESFLNFYSLNDPDIWHKYREMLSKHDTVYEAFISTFKDEYSIYKSIIDTNQLLSLDGDILKRFYDELNKKGNEYSFMMTNFEFD